MLVDIAYGGSYIMMLLDKGIKIIEIMIKTYNSAQA